MKKLFFTSVSVCLVCLVSIGCSPAGPKQPAPTTYSPTVALPEIGVPVVSAPATTVSQPVTTGTPGVGPLQGEVQLIVTPNPQGHVEFIAAINKTKAGDVIRMTMFHITDSGVINALTAAQARGVAVKVIVDSVSLNIPNFNLGYQRLINGGVETKASSSGFSITHQKSMVINNSEAYITAINLTGLVETTRDFGLIVHDRFVIDEVITVFEQDWLNASTQQSVTPNLTVAHLLWSPVNALSKLLAAIAAAKVSLAIEIENLGSAEIQAGLIAAAKRGVIVRVLAPQCSKGNAKLNYPYLKELAAGGVLTKVMPEPASSVTPYLHSKMMLVDQSLSYVGSINFSTNSTTRARELGIIFSEDEIIQQLASYFEADWKAAVNVPEESSVTCSLF